jgi:hypothetical protein
MTNKLYTREIFKLSAKITAPLISKFERDYPEHPRIDGDFQPIFIIGAPRTGSTILYQILSNELSLLYIDNFIDVYHRNFLWAFKTSYKLFGDKPHNCFNSVHGSTWKCGLHAPSECGDFWYQWLPREKHFVDFDDFNESIVENVQYELYSVINSFNKHLLLKNLNAGQRLRLLSKVCPDAKFIYVVRDKIDTASSILITRKKFNLGKGEWWSVKPGNYENLLKMDEHEMIINQIYNIEKQIFEDIKLFPAGNHITISYDEIIDDYKNIVSKIKKFIDTKIEYRDNRIEPVISRKQSNQNDSNRELFMEYFNKLDWERIEFD